MLTCGMEITFITINTGHVTLIREKDVMPKVVDVLRPLIDAGGGEIPYPSSYYKE